MHLYLYDAVTLACLTSAAFYVKTEPAGLVSPDPGFRQHGKHFADVCKDACVCGWIRAGRPADGALINVDRLVNIVNPLD
jgi:hypothetical protein